MKEFKKYAIIPATPEELYLALTTEITARFFLHTPPNFPLVFGQET